MPRWRGIGARLTKNSNGLSQVAIWMRPRCLDSIIFEMMPSGAYGDGDENWWNLPLRVGLVVCCLRDDSE